MEIEVGEPVAEGVDGVGAGEDEPVIAGEADQSSIEALCLGWRGDLEDGDEDGGCTEGVQLLGERRCLLAGAKDEDTAAGEREGCR